MYACVCVLVCNLCVCSCIAVPPVRVSVRWWMGNSGNTEENGEVGPFREGDAPTLVCITRNGEY